jgi:hypothetical protein
MNQNSCVFSQNDPVMRRPFPLGRRAPFERAGSPENSDILHKPGRKNRERSGDCAEPRRSVLKIAGFMVK